MKSKFMQHTRLSLALLFSCAGLANAQYFNSNDGDLILGFGKNASDEVVVNIGSVTNLLVQAPGTTNAIGNFSPSQLTTVYGGSFANLQVSVFGAFSTAPWVG